MFVSSQHAKIDLETTTSTVTVFKFIQTENYGHQQDSRGVLEMEEDLRLNVL